VLSNKPGPEIKPDIEDNKDIDSKLNIPSSGTSVKDDVKENP
jgi:hypothetical protein